MPTTPRALAATVAGHATNMFAVLLVWWSLVGTALFLLDRISFGTFYTHGIALGLGLIVAFCFANAAYDDDFTADEIVLFGQPVQGRSFGEHNAHLAFQSAREDRPS